MRFRCTPRNGDISDLKCEIIGEYENHHLLCPIHGRTIPRGDVASCGCKPTIMWTTATGIEVNPQTDNMGLRYRGL